MNYSVAKAFLVLASPSFASPLGKRELRRRGEDANHLHSCTDLLCVVIMMDAKFALVKAPYQAMTKHAGEPHTPTVFICWHCH